MKMVTGRARKNLKALLENNPDIIADIVGAYASGDDITEVLQAYGISEAAIKEHHETLAVAPPPKPKRKRSVKKKKDTPPSLEN